MTPEERAVLEHYAGFIPLPLRSKPMEEIDRYHAWGWSAMESALDAKAVVGCLERGWLEIFHNQNPVRCRTTSLGVLALGQLS